MRKAGVKFSEIRARRFFERMFSIASSSKDKGGSSNSSSLKSGREMALIKANNNRAPTSPRATDETQT